jgi:hypothetical protein
MSPDNDLDSHIIAVCFISFFLKMSTTKNPHQLNDEDLIKKGSVILSHIIAVPSAQAGLTSLFEMGRGEPRRNNHLKNLCRKVFKSYVLKSSRDIMTFDILTLKHLKLCLIIS